MIKLKETKIIAILIVLFLCVLSLPKYIRATDYTSTNFIVTNPVIDQGSSSTTSTNFGLGQSVSQTAIGTSTSTNFRLWSGFQYYFKVNANVLTATPGDSQVLLSWTVPQTFLGISVASYEVGVGTVSGSYVFTDRGNVTSWTQTGLTNGTTYYFIIKAKAVGGLFLVFSNEATATPTGSGGGGGGGGGGYTPPAPPPTPGNGSIVLSGLAYPGRQVTILRDGTVAAATTADPGAQFNVTLGNLGPGTYNISLYATDETGKQSPTLSFPQTLTADVTITVNNLFLGPTIGVSHNTIRQGETLSIFGYTVPSSDVSVFVNSHIQYIERIRSNSLGAYFKAFNTTPLELGDHSTKSQTETTTLLSPYSFSAAFKVGDTSEEVPEGECKRSDLNCDGRINLTDFSILLFYWNKTNPANARADINGSNFVDLTDFSIMLFDWTG